MTYFLLENVPFYSDLDTIEDTQDFIQETMEDARFYNVAVQYDHTVVNNCPCFDIDCDHDDFTPGDVGDLRVFLRELFFDGDVRITDEYSIFAES